MRFSKRLAVVSILFASIFTTLPLFAAEFPAQARLFAGITEAKPADLNEEMRAQGIKEFKSIAKFGVEITYPVAKLLDVGMNYTKRHVNNGEVNETVNANYHAVLDQDAVQLLARVPFWRTRFSRVDIFGAVGGTNTSLSVRTVSQDGKLTRRESNDWFASPITTFGASASVGFKNFFFVVEGGMETNKVGSFKREGNINGNVDKIDLSGSYIQIALMFDGITATSK